MNIERFDLIVLGGGSAARDAASRAMNLYGAKRVALVERERWGGSCPNVACKPTKAYLVATDLFRDLRTLGPELGLGIDYSHPDLARIKAWKDSFLRSQESWKELLKSNGYELVDGQATFVDPKTIKVADRQLTAGKILITTGSRTAVPNIPGISEIDWIDHISALELTELPKSMIVLGGGPVGLELAQAFARFGSRVTIVNSGPHMAARSDQEAAEELQKALAEDGIELVHNSRPKAVEKSNDGISVTLDPSGQKISAEKLMLASGRTINVEELNLPAAGVEYSPRSIKVDEQMRTTADGIWAAGDVTGIQFTPVAQYQARIAVDDMFGKPRAADYRFLPTAIFTDPEIAGVGLTEEAARQAGLDFATAVHPLRNVTRAKYYKAEHGLFKVVYNKSSRAVLGIHIVSRNASDIVQGFALAMQKGITVDDLVNMHHIYPSYGEGIKAAAERALP